MNTILKDVNSAGDVIYHGGSNVVPATIKEVLALSATPYFDEVIINASTIHRINNIIIKSDYSIVKAEDMDNPVCRAVDYSLRGTMNINGADYNVYSFELGIPFSIGYRHKFLIRTI